MQFSRAGWIAIVLVALLAGLVLGQEDGMDSQGQEFEWAMFGQRIVAAGGGGSDDDQQSPEMPVFVEGTSFLYNRRTGKVFRVFLGCGEVLGRNGCLEELPVVRPNEQSPDPTPPPPASMVAPNQLRR